MTVAASFANSTQFVGVSSIKIPFLCYRKFPWPSSSGAPESWLCMDASITPNRRQQKYLRADRTWGATHAGILRTRPVAYFSAEFGIHESLPIYSGGLGVLAGDHIKSASDLDIPLVGIGLFYGQGYFRQHLDREGWQREQYMQTHSCPNCDRRRSHEKAEPLLS